MEEDDYIDEDMGEDYDPYDGMTEEEIKEKLPPYWFKSNKQKKKFFRNMNIKFKEKL